MLNFTKTSTTRLIAIGLATSVATTALAITDEAYAHDRHNWQIHNGDPYTWNKRAHRQYHKHLKQQQHHSHKRKSRKRDLIAAGIIGLAVGAIIANSAKKHHRTPQQPVTDYHPEYQPGYTYGTQDYDPYYDDNHGHNHDSGIRQPLSDLPPESGHVTRDNGPNVITYEDTVTLEPWTPSWYDYCSSKYRSFNPKRGTFLGYDGKHHFCVAK